MSDTPEGITFLMAEKHAACGLDETAQRSCRDPKGGEMSDTPRTDAEALKSRPPFTFVTSKFAEELERECNQRKADWNKACDEQGWLMLECDGHRAKAAKLRKALQSVMDWNPKPEYWERPEAVARFEADMARAREVLEETQETKPHHWEDRALTAERERDEALNVLREINNWINVAVMRPPTPNEAAYAINAWGDKIRPILEVTE